jgi:hypothetical protein
MTTRLISLILSLFLLSAVFAQTNDNYDPGPDSKPQAGVPKGEVLKFTFDNSKIFPGTTRDYWVYVPAQYKPETPARLCPAGRNLALKRPRFRQSHS